jgi:hypothetical protein
MILCRAIALLIGLLVLAAVGGFGGEQPYKDTTDPAKAKTDKDAKDDPKPKTLLP